MGRLFYLSKTGTVRELAKDLVYPNGVAIHKGTLYVSEHLKGRVIKYPIQKDSTLGTFQIFTEFQNVPSFRDKDPDYVGPDGIEISKNGTIYIANYGRGRILIYGQDGTYKKSIQTHLPFITNMAIDKSNNTLVITGAKTIDTRLQAGEVFRRKIEKNND